MCGSTFVSLVSLVSLVWFMSSSGASGEGTFGTLGTDAAPGTWAVQPVSQFSFGVQRQVPQSTKPAGHPVMLEGLA